MTNVQEPAVRDCVVNAADVVTAAQLARANRLLAGFSSVTPP